MRTDKKIIDKLEDLNKYILTTMQSIDFNWSIVHKLQSEISALKSSVEEESKDCKKCKFEYNIKECDDCDIPGTKFQPKSDSKGLTADQLDLIQYVTNLLYFAHKDAFMRSDEFDKWVEERTNELKEYAIAYSESREEMTDEEINKQFPKFNSNGKYLEYNVVRQEGAKWYRDRKK